MYSWAILGLQSCLMLKCHRRVRKITVKHHKCPHSAEETSNQAQVSEKGVGIKWAYTVGPLTVLHTFTGVFNYTWPIRPIIRQNLHPDKAVSYPSQIKADTLTCHSRKSSWEQFGKLELAHWHSCFNFTLILPVLFLLWHDMFLWYVKMSAMKRCNKQNQLENEKDVNQV